MSYMGASGFNAEEGVPDFVVTAHNGFRAWALRTPKMANGELSSLCQNHTWSEGRQESRCGTWASMWMWASKVKSDKPCEFPTKGCSHGFYAYYDVDYFREAGTLWPRVNGVMEGWGRCVVGSLGFRAQFGRISAFVGPVEFTDEWLKKADLSRSEAEAKARDLVERAYPTIPWFDTVELMSKVIPLLGRPNISRPSTEGDSAA